MKKSLIRGLVPVFAAGSLIAGGMAAAAPANAGCQEAWFGVGWGERCDWPIAPNGMFQRCDKAVVFGFGGGPNCYLVNVHNLAGNPPHIPGPIW